MVVDQTLCTLKEKAYLMCGIAGAIDFYGSKVDKALLQKMNSSLLHRGPDAEGYWLNEKENVGLAHRRLSIIDLSAQGNQPMHFDGGKYVISYNGELYNYIELKESLIKKGYTFKTETDTEVILAMYAEYGSACLSHFDGMFAFAIWDENKQQLFCARDRFGEKPFYYFKDENRLLFASEIKALWSAGIQKNVTEEAIFRYLMFGVTNSGEQTGDSFFKGIKKLPPAHSMTIQLNGELSIQKYWELKIERRANISVEEGGIQLLELLKDSVRKRLRSDVPVGSSLSGGLDSTTIVYLMDEILKKQGAKVNTFTIRYPGFDRDEGKYVDQIDQDIEIQRNDVFPSDEEISSDFEQLQFIQDEPFGSFSISSQNRVYKAARDQGVKVMLDGQGADEILAGYTRDRAFYYRDLRKTNKSLYKSEMNSYSELYGQEFQEQAWLKRTIDRLPISSKKLRKGVQSIRKDDSSFFLGIHPEMVKKYKHIDNPITPPNSFRDTLLFSIQEKGLTELLRYADRNSMNYSVEVRLPFLSHQLVEFLFSLPDEFLIQNAWTKYILRQSVQSILPKSICWRSDKIGFDAPQDQLFSTQYFQSTLKDSIQFLQKNGIIAQENSHLNWNYVMLAYYLR